MIRRTPIVRDRGPWPTVGFKLENLQRTGSFKLRGAWRAVAGLGPEARARGLVVASAGNHGAGIALAARAHAARATVLVPRGTPEVKRALMRELGAEVLEVGASYDEAERAARDLSRARGASFVSAFDDDAVVAGNGGDLGRELAAQVPDLVRVVATVGGGGLLGGLAAELGPRGVSVVGVGPEANCAMFDSLAGGHALTAYAGGATLAEGCEGAVAVRTFELVRRHGDGVVRVSEAAIRRAVGFAYRELGTIVEPTGAVGLAGLLEGQVVPRDGGTTVVILSGGNLEPDLLDEILAER